MCLRPTKLINHSVLRDAVKAVAQVLPVIYVVMIPALHADPDGLLVAGQVAEWRGGRPGAFGLSRPLVSTAVSLLQQPCPAIVLPLLLVPGLLDGRGPPTQPAEPTRSISEPGKNLHLRCRCWQHQGLCTRAHRKPQAACSC